jgi:hypothetical protein
VSDEAIQTAFAVKVLDCFASLAMTMWRNYGFKISFCTRQFNSSAT